MEGFYMQKGLEKGSSNKEWMFQARSPFFRGRAGVYEAEFLPSAA